MGTLQRWNCMLAGSMRHFGLKKTYVILVALAILQAFFALVSKLVGVLTYD